MQNMVIVLVGIPLKNIYRVLYTKIFQILDEDAQFFQDGSKKSVLIMIYKTPRNRKIIQVDLYIL